MNWPNDADGDVFRRLLEHGFDFEGRYTIDFNVDFDRWPPIGQALELLRQHHPDLTIHEPNSGVGGHLMFQVHERPTYEFVTQVQREISDLMAPFGGRCNSWGILHEELGTRF